MRFSIDFKDLLDSSIFIDIPRYWYSKNAGFHIVSWDQTAEIKVLNHVRLYLRLCNFSDNNRAPDLDFSVLLWAHEPQRFNGSLGGGVAQTKNNTQNLSNLEACCSQKVHIYIRLRIRVRRRCRGPAWLGAVLWNCLSSFARALLYSPPNSLALLSTAFSLLPLYQ